MRGRLGPVALLVADQGACSLGNFSLLAVGARALGAHELGLLSLCITVGLLALGCGRAVGGEALALRWSGAPRAAFTGQASGALMASLAVALLLTGLASLLLATVWDASAVATAAMPVLSVVTFQDATRYVLMAQGRPGVVLACDLLMVALQLGGFGLLTLADRFSPSAILLVWGGAGLGAALVGMVAAGCVLRPAALWAWGREVRDLAPKLLLDFGIQSGLGQASLLVVSALLSVVALGHLRLGYLALGPLNILLLSMLTTGLPHAVRTGRRSTQSLRRLAAAISVVAGAAAVLWTATLLLVPAPVATAVLGPEWSNARQVLAPLGLGYVATGLSAGPMLRLQASAAMDRLIRTRVAVAVPTLLLPALAAVPFGILGAAWGLCVAAWLGTVQWLRASAALTRNGIAPPPTDRPAPAAIGGKAREGV